MSATRHRSWAAALIAMMVAFSSACSPPPEAPSLPASSPSPSAAHSRAPLTPSEVAWEFAEQGRLRLVYASQASEGNAYQKLLELNSTKGGLREAAERAQKEGVSAVAASLPDFDSEEQDLKNHSFFQDYLLVLKVGTYRHLGAQVEVPETGAVTIKNEEAFVKACSALWLLPALEVGNPDVEDQLEHFRTYLGIARTICLDAATVQHYEAGVDLQQRTLDNLAEVVRSGTLSVLELREVIASLQELVSSELELQQVIDTEYFLAVRRLEERALEPSLDGAEKDALAERFLAVRTLASDPTAAEHGFNLELAPPSGQAAQEWAQKGDYLPSLVRSRRALTQLSANKILAGLQAYRKEHGFYPDKVGQLKPAYLSTIATDWLTPGGEFVYEKTKNSFKLASVLSQEAGETRIEW